METIEACETLHEVDAIEAEVNLSNEERRALFERWMQIFCRIREWLEENERLGIESTISDYWTPGQREIFLGDWFDDHSIDEGALQTGRGEKRSHEDDDDDERPYAIENVKEVNIKKFRTKGTNYTRSDSTTLWLMMKLQLHERLHDVFQQILNDTTGAAPSHDQIRMIIHSTQLKKPIAFLFMTPQDLTTERILSEFQRVIQSNQEFRLNDMVDVNVIHVSLPSGGKRGKRTNLNLEKHLEKKRSVIRIQNNDDLCMARALVVAKAKLDNNPQYKSIVDHRRPMQTRLAQELHTNAGVPLGPCGIEEAKKF